MALLYTDRLSKRISDKSLFPVMNWFDFITGGDGRRHASALMLFLSWLFSSCQGQEIAEGSRYSKSKIIEFGTLEAILRGVSAGLGTARLKSAVDCSTHGANVYIHQAPAKVSRLRDRIYIQKRLFMTSAFQTFIDEVNEMKR